VEELKEELLSLEAKKKTETDFEKKLEYADRIHNIKMQIDGIKPMDSSIDCIGCSG